MGVFDESERRRTKVSQDSSRSRTDRRPWPLSARLLVGAMLVFNILLVAFIGWTELGRPGAPATSAPIPLEQPKADASPEVNAPVDTQPNATPGAPADAGSSLDGKTPPAEAVPAALPGAQTAKPPAGSAQQAARTQRPVYPAPKPRPGVNSPPERLGLTPAPVAASQGTSVNAAPPVAASLGAAGAAVRGNAASAAKAPAPSVQVSPVTGHGLPAQATRPATTNRVAPVGLPAMEKGTAMQKKPVVSVASQIEIIHQPPGEVVNCGTDDAFLACPTLHTRPETPIPSEEP